MTPRILLLVTCLVLASPPALARKGAGEVNTNECECQTCLIKNGVCIKSKANDDRIPTDKTPKPPKKKSGGGAIQQ